MSALVVASLVRNEAGKYWKSALDAWGEFADRILVLDDNSTDKTAKIAYAHPKVECVQRYGEDVAWGAESSARRELWDYAFGETQVGDYILWLDADMVPLGDPRELMHPGCDTYYFALYDLWGQDANGRLVYRDDAFWSAHYRPRPWMIRRPSRFNAEWNTRGIHSGHLPKNWLAGCGMYAPPSHSLLHYGYYDERDRATKVADYLNVSHQLNDAQQAHARSIVDESPPLKPLLTNPSWTLKRAR